MNFSDFWNSTSGVSRIIWKASIPFLLITLICLLLFTITIAIGKNNSLTVMALWVLPVFVFIWIIPKLMIVVPYLTINRDAGLTDALRFSNGFNWYLSKTIILLFLIFMIIAIPISLLKEYGTTLPEAFGIIVIIFLNILDIIIQYILVIFLYFVNVNSYIKIMKTKASK